jgi:hypothetical protein
MAENNAESCKPGGTGPAKNSELIPQHKRMAMGSPPKPSGPSAKP